MKSFTCFLDNSSTKMRKSSFWKNKKVVVTGSGGFLGGHFACELKKLRAEVILASHNIVNLLDYDQTNSIFKNAEVVINCAAIDGNTEFKIKHATEILDSDLRITSNVLNAAKANKVRDIVIFSSAEVYSPNVPNPIKEEDDYRIYNEYTQNRYVLSKRYSEIFSYFYRKEFNLQIYLPRPSNIYGPNDHFGKNENRVIPSFIKKIAASEPIEIWGDGSQIRQFIYVKDLVYSVLSMVEKNYTGVLNVSTDEFISILNLAKIIYECFDKTQNINLNPAKLTGVKNRILDISKMYELIDFKLTLLKNGIQQTINWYQNSKL